MPPYRCCCYGWRSHVWIHTRNSPLAVVPAVLAAARRTASAQDHATTMCAPDILLRVAWVTTLGRYALLTRILRSAVLVRRAFFFTWIHGLDCVRHTGLGLVDYTSGYTIKLHTLTAAGSTCWVTAIPPFWLLPYATLCTGCGIACLPRATNRMDAHTVRCRHTAAFACRVPPRFSVFTDF